MKKLSDYKGEEALTLWADILEPLTKVVLDKEIKNAMSEKSKMELATMIFRNHPKEISEVLLRIDDTPLDGLNVATRLVFLLKELGESDEMQGFFG